MDPIRIQMPKEMFSPAAHAHYEGEVSVGILKCGADLYDFKEPLHWDVDVTNTGDALLVGGTVEGDAVGSCVRCLEPVAFPVTGEIEGYFLIGPDSEEPEDMEDDEFDVLPDDKTIDMAPLIHAALLLEMPRMLLCKEDCRGICPHCGAQRNDGPCGCEDDSGGAAKEGPFSALKDFQF